MKNEVLADLILPIVNSENFSGYAIGLSRNISARRASYKRINWNYFYIIEVDLTQEKALKLEKQYFDYVTSDDESIYYQKYHPDKRDENHKASIGGVGKTASTNKNYAIYVACYA